MEREEIQAYLGQETKYSRWYLNIIFKAKSEKRKKLKKDNPLYTYYENHHILPKSIFPEYSDLKNNEWNGVLLTAREHILIHLIVFKHYEKIKDNINKTKMSHPLIKIIGSTNMPVSKYISKKAKSLQSESMSNEKYNCFSVENPSYKLDYICEFCDAIVSKSAYLRWHSWNCLQNPNLIIENRGVSPILKEDVYFLCRYCDKPLNKSNIHKHNENCLHNPSHPKKDIKIEGNKITSIQCEWCSKWCDANSYFQSHHNNCSINPNSDTYKRREQKIIQKRLMIEQREIELKGSFVLLNLLNGEKFRGKYEDYKNENFIVAKSTKKVYVLKTPNDGDIMYMSRHGINNYSNFSRKIQSFIFHRANKGVFTPFNKMLNDINWIALKGFESITINVDEILDYLYSNPQTKIIK